MISRAYDLILPKTQSFGLADLRIVVGHRRGYLSYADTGFQHPRVISVLSAAGEQFAVTVRKAAAPRGFRGAAGDAILEQQF